MQSIQSKYRILLILLLLCALGIINSTRSFAGPEWPANDDPLIEKETDSIGVHFRGGKGPTGRQTCPTNYIVQKYMFQSTRGINDAIACYSVYNELTYKGGKGQTFSTNCPYGYQLIGYNYMFQGSKGISYSSSCYSEYTELTYKGGKGQTFSTSCPYGYDLGGIYYMFQGSKGINYASSCYTTYMEKAYLGGKGQTFYTNCLPDPVSDFLTRGGSGDTYFASCPVSDIISIHKGGAGQTSYTTCGTDFISVFTRGGEGQTFYASCPTVDIISIHRGGSGQTSFTTCGTDNISIFTKGGLGQTYFSSCPDFNIISIHRGGIGQTFYTTCQTDLISIVSRGGVGQMAYTTCFDDFSDLINKGGVGQTFYTTCETDLIGRINRGGVGQMSYTTCNDNFFDRVTKGGIGQTFFASCADVVSLFIRKAVSEAISCTGRTNIFTITLENKDWAIYDLKDVSVRDSLGLGLSYKEYSATAGTYNSGTGIWTIPSIGRGETHTLTLKARSDVKGELTNYAWITDASILRAVVRDTARASVLTKEGGIPRVDFRTQVSIDPKRQIKLASYLDTLFQHTLWNIVESPVINPGDMNDMQTKGLIKTDNFVAGKTYSYWVRVEDECLTDTVKAYVKVLGNLPLYPNDRTLTVCYMDEKLLNITALIGIDAGQVQWNVFPITATSYLSISSRGAAVFNVEKAYLDNSIPSVSHNGGTNNAKEITIGFKVTQIGSKLKDKEYSVKVIITDRLLP